MGKTQRRAAPGPAPGLRGTVRELASIESALDWAEVAAMLGDFHEAVSWLECVEWLQGTLPPELAERRTTWACAAGLNPD
jgi:hypothetical protein